MTTPIALPVASPFRRWWILAFISIALFGNYYVYDSIAPVADLLQQGLGFSDTQIGMLNAIYSVPNIAMVLIGGVLVDRFGAARVTLWTAALCLAGALLTAVGSPFVVMAMGRLLFGLGAETMIVATLVALGHWFAGHRVALAMAISVSVARAGSYAADLSPSLAKSLYDQGWQAPLVLAAGFAAVAAAAVVAYWWLDARGAVRAAAPPPAAERFVWADLWRFDRSYWYLLAVCVLYYSAIFPFRSTFAIKYFQHAQGLTLEAAGLMNSYVFLAAIFATPAFGWLTDRIGRRALLMALGSCLLAASFVLLSATTGHLGVATTLIGISFSLVPAVLWPAVSLLVEPHRLGTAYGLMTLLQNVGLAICNVFAGWLNDLYNAGATHPAGYQPMLWFFGSLGVLSCGFGVGLWRRERGPQGHGLEVVTRPTVPGDGASPGG
jgi:MFS family permease